MARMSDDSDDEFFFFLEMVLTADFDGGLEVEEVGLRQEDALGRDAEVPDLPLRHLHLLPLPVHQSLYYAANVDLLDDRAKR